ncbi:MAG TPA: zf-HC2 domain-containing protein, partial [Anaeromyxobacteraceae bacterium]|nr:zf-HC2 domain-containing protein [Anaeromyxobacteraceae bacterium]
MTHQECQDRLLEFAYGELDRRRAGEVQAHLEACPACAGVYRRIAGVREVMGRLEPEPPPDGGERVVLAAAREAADRRREERPSLGLPLWAWKASVATVLVAAVAGVSVKIVSMRQRSQVEEVAAAPVAAGRAPEAPTPPMPPSASAPAE